MTNLNDEHLIVDPNAVSPWPVAIRYGLIGGLIYCIYTLIGSLSGLISGGLGLVSFILSGLLAFFIAIGLIVFSVKKHRDKELGGFITIGRVIIIGLVITGISMFISNVFTYVYVNFIDPSFIDNMQGNMGEMFEGFVPEEELERIILDAGDRFEIGNLIKGFFGTVVGVGLVVSAIIGLIMKKDPPRM